MSKSLPGRHEIGPLVVWANRRKDGVNAQVSIHWRNKRLGWVRFGRGGWRPELFIRWHDYFGGRIQIAWGEK